MSAMQWTFAVYFFSAVAVYIFLLINKHRTDFDRVKVGAFIPVLNTILLCTLLISFIENIFDYFKKKNNNINGFNIQKQDGVTHIFVDSDTKKVQNSSGYQHKILNNKVYYVDIPKGSSSKNAGKHLPVTELQDEDLRIIRNVSDDYASIINSTWEFAKRNQAAEVAYGSFNQFSPAIMLHGLLSCQILNNPEKEWIIDYLRSSVLGSSTNTYSSFTGKPNLNLRMRAAYFLAALGGLNKSHEQENDHSATAKVIRSLLQAKDINNIAAIAIRNECIPNSDCDLARLRLKEELEQRD